uniref:uncharacterized protein isoform X1 n=1 Tax=Centroberyx gerrardi TaxID=166262 RepID=UPI003AAD690A
MPASKVIKPRPVETTTKLLEKSKPVKTKPANRAESELKVPAVRKSRAASCPRCPQSNRCEGVKQQSAASKARCERRARSTCTAPKPAGNCPKTSPTCQKTTSPTKHGAVTSKPGETQREQRTDRAKMQCANQSHKAFTVIPPNPKKRKEIQKKAEAELAALEELRLSRAMGYVSINPSSVGGCMSLEEVRLKQQQEMMQARRKQKQMKKHVMEPTAVLIT